MPEKETKRHTKNTQQLTKVRVNLSQTCSDLEKSARLIHCQQRVQDAISFGRERYICFTSNWTNERNMWVLPNKSNSQPESPKPTHTKRATESV